MLEALGDPLFWKDCGTSAVNVLPLLYALFSGYCIGRYWQHREEKFHDVVRVISAELDMKVYAAHGELGNCATPPTFCGCMYCDNARKALGIAPLKDKKTISAGPKRTAR